MPDIKLAKFNPLAQDPKNREEGVTWQHLRDVTLQVTVELGETTLRIGELLNLGKGSVIELNQLAGEKLKIKVNGKLFAYGEAVVIDDHMGVRILEIAAPVATLLS